METYTLLRQIADSWVLLAMVLFFLGTAVWAFLPSQRRAREDAAQIPFRNDDTAAAAAKTCRKNCAGCACTGLKDLKGIGDV